MLKAILFDLGGTLFDQEPVPASAYHGAARKTYEFLRARDCRLPAFPWYFSRKCGSVVGRYLWSRVSRRDFSTFDILRRHCRHMNLSPAELHELAGLWYEPIAAQTTVARDVVPTLSRLRDRGLSLGLVSNTFIPACILDRHLEQHGLLEFFPVRIYSSEIGHRKPYRPIFEIALKQIGAQARQAMFVGDRVRNDVWGASRLGMRTVLRNPAAATLAHPLADCVIRKISELHQVLPMPVKPPIAEPLPALEELAYDA